MNRQAERVVGFAVDAGATDGAIDYLELCIAEENIGDVWITVRDAFQDFPEPFRTEWLAAYAVAFGEWAATTDSYKRSGGAA